MKFDASEPVEPGGVKLRAELYKPQGEGPFPAVVLMHGCGGWQPAVRFSLQEHATDLQSRGYVVFNLDSFGPRYYSGDEMCASNAKLLRALKYRTSDAFDAARYLAGLPFVDRRNIFLMGQSNGGSVAMRAAEADIVHTYAPAPTDVRFRAIAAYYPWCGVYRSNVSLSAPVQIFSGGQDNWVSAEECTSVRVKGAQLDVVVYPQARHSFDVELIPQQYMGFLIGKDPVAAADSKRRMAGFFEKNLVH
ncbi:MAG: dienelactone hydrolase family protein [Proteobacteria bacterium]|nr:dienelactone hydrolase family protein [Pseudomonadota bacterium]